MTIEIHQLIIRAVVDESVPPGTGAAAAALAGPTAATGGQAGPPWTPEDRQALLAACVREVVRRLERARER